MLSGYVSGLFTAIDWDIWYCLGLFGIVWDFRGYISGLFDYFLRRNVIEWDAVNKQVSK